MKGELITLMLDRAIVRQPIDREPELATLNEIVGGYLEQGRASTRSKSTARCAPASRSTMKRETGTADAVADQYPRNDRVASRAAALRPSGAMAVYLEVLSITSDSPITWSVQSSSSPAMTSWLPC